MTLFVFVACGRLGARWVLVRRASLTSNPVRWAVAASVWVLIMMRLPAAESRCWDAVVGPRRHWPGLSQSVSKTSFPRQCERRARVALWRGGLGDRPPAGGCETGAGRETRRVAKRAWGDPSW